MTDDLSDGLTDGLSPGEAEDLRTLLLDAVPPLAAPPDRLVRVAHRVRRRRRQRVAWAAFGTVLVLGGGTGLVRAVTAGPASGLPAATSGPSTLRPVVDVPTAPDGAPVPAPSGAPSTGPSAVSGTAAATSAGPAATTPPSRAGDGPAADAVPGVAFDPARVPSGSAGSDRRRVVTASEQPDPGNGIGIFRTVCLYSHMTTDDVLGRVGAPAVPLRTAWGSTAARGDERGPWPATGRSTCRGGTVDRSVYWTPSVVDTRTGTPVAPTVVHVHYSSGYQGVRPQDVRAFPAGLRMVSDVGPAHAGWACWGSGTRSATVPDCGGGQVELAVTFPQCWDGDRLDSPDHRAHLAYPNGSGCPASHPVALPEITFHVVYDPTAAADVARWRLSTDAPGAPAGSSAQGGWANGWDTGVASAWTTHCVRAAVSCRSHLLGDGRALEGDA